MSLNNKLLVAGAIYNAGSFADGAMLAANEQFIFNEADKSWYYWSGVFPKEVPANSTPDATGGIGEGAWVNVGDSAIRDQMTDPDGAINHPDLQMSRWRDCGDIRGFGVTSTDITKLNQFISLGTGPRVFRVPPGIWKGFIRLKSRFGLSGESLINTSLIVPTDITGISVTGNELRGTKIKDLMLSVEGAISGGLPVGSGIGLDCSGVEKVVNCEVANLYLDFFDIGFRSGPADFSCVYNNVRASNNRIGFLISSNGQIIQNTYNNIYASSWTELGMRISGANNLVFNAANFGSIGATFLNIAINSRGIIFNAPNFEMDSGTLPANSHCVVVQSDSVVTFNSPTFVKPKAEDGLPTYLYRVKDTAVVYINNPIVTLDGNNIRHLSVEGNSTVYLCDPKGVFTRVDTSGNGQIIRIDKITNAPDVIMAMTIKSGTIIPLGFYAKYALARPDFHSTAVPNPFRYDVQLDSYTSTAGTVTARVVDTTTGAHVYNVDVNVVIEAWRS